MMKWIFGILILLSLVFGGINGRMEEVSSAAISSCGGAVELVLTLAGSMALWSGLMRAAQGSGLTEKLAALLSPLTTRLFRGVKKGSKALQLITMNITANLLGLGNAATPLGLSAMEELRREAASSPDESSDAPSDNMVLLVVLNTASIQLIPTTVAILRLKYGSASPMEIVPAVLLSSAVSVTVGICLCKICSRLGRRRK